MSDAESSEAIQALLRDAKTIAVVGLSGDPNKPSYGVAAYLQQQGYTIVPITPKGGRILDAEAYPDLASVPFPIDVVDIFRRSEAVGPHVDEAIAVGAKAVWLQLGIQNDAAIERAKAAGLVAVQDRCMKIEHMRMRR